MEGNSDNMSVKGDKRKYSNSGKRKKKKKKSTKKENTTTSQNGYTAVYTEPLLGGKIKNKKIPPKNKTEANGDIAHANGNTTTTGVNTGNCKADNLGKSGKPGYKNKTKRGQKKLGANVTSEHSIAGEGDTLNALASQDLAKPNGNVGGSPSKSIHNSLGNKLQDSKSNRLLQSINPEESYRQSKVRQESTQSINDQPISNGLKYSKTDVTSNTKTREKISKKSLNTKEVSENKRKHLAVKQSNTNSNSSASKLLASEANGYVQRNRTKNFPGVMEILGDDEDVSELPENGNAVKESVSSSNRSPSKNISSPVTTSPLKADIKQENKHANKNGFLPNNNKSPETSPTRKENPKTKQPRTRNSQNVCVEERPKVENTAQLASPRYTPVLCKNHPNRSSVERLEAVLFCAMCADSVCYKCAFERHKDHDVSPISSAADTIRVKLAERKRKIEANISHLRTRRKASEATSQDMSKRIQVQFSAIMERIREKEQEVLEALEKSRQQNLTGLYKLQTQQETSWSQIDAVLKTVEDAKMLQEYTMLDPVATCMEFSPCTSTDSGCMSPVHVSPRASLDLQDLRHEIEKISLQCDEPDLKSPDGNLRSSVGLGDNDVFRKAKKKYLFKLDPESANPALRVSPNGCVVEFIGSERNTITKAQRSGYHNVGNSTKANLSPNHPLLQGATVAKWRKTQFATVLADIPITQGKQYWEVSVNRSMEYRLGVSYKHMQGTKTLPDDHNSWVLSLTYPDRFSAMHKGRKEYIFASSQHHTTLRNSKVIRIGLFLDYERGILSFYNATNSVEKRHLHTFRTFFNRPVWPLVSLRQGKLQIVTGIPVPRNLIWKTR